MHGKFYRFFLEELASNYVISCKIDYDGNWCFLLGNCFGKSREIIGGNRDGVFLWWEDSCWKYMVSGKYSKEDGVKWGAFLMIL